MFPILSFHLKTHPKGHRRVPQLKTSLISVSSSTMWTLRKAPAGHNDDGDGTNVDGDDEGDHVSD